MSQPMALHPDRALPADPHVREIARRIYQKTADLPLVCMHGHVEAGVFADNRPFADPAQLLVVPDHYITRMLVSQGARLEQLGVPRLDDGDTETDSRAIWTMFCRNWHLFRGTPSRYWLEHELVEVFGVTERPGADSADRIYDQIAATIADPAFRPLELLDRFRIELLTTTDPATSALSHHAHLAANGFAGRIIPTFRPDAVLRIARGGWRHDVARLSALADVDTGDYAGFLEALRRRRAAFISAGALATDHGHTSADTTPLSAAEADRIYSAALFATVSPAEAEAFAAHMLYAMAEMSRDDGLVMQIHPGVRRDHHSGIASAFGADKGFDIPIGTEFTRALRPILDAFGHDPSFRVVLFTVDETTYSRELAPLAGAYPAVRLGAPWWFLDAPDAMRRFREAATETAGFYNTSGFVDDTRAFVSIPARHDLARRIDAGHLARLVAEHRLDEGEAVETAFDLAYHLPKQAYAPIG